MNVRTTRGPRRPLLEDEVQLLTPSSAALSRFLTARWIHLAMLNYEVPSSLLVKRVPPGTETLQRELRSPAHEPYR